MLRRIASTAAWSAALLLPWPIQWEAAIAAASVIRTSSRLGVRSRGIRSRGGVACVFTSAVTLVRNRRSRTHQTLRCALDERQRFAHRLRDRQALARDGDRVEPEGLVSRAETARDRADRPPGCPRGCGRWT